MPFCVSSELSHMCGKTQCCLPLHSVLLRFVRSTYLWAMLVVFGNSTCHVQLCFNIMNHVVQLAVHNNVRINL